MCIVASHMGTRELVLSVWRAHSSAMGPQFWRCQRSSRALSRRTSCSSARRVRKAGVVGRRASMEHALGARTLGTRSVQSWRAPSHCGHAFRACVPRPGHSGDALRTLHLLCAHTPGLHSGHALFMLNFAASSCAGGASGTSSSARIDPAELCVRVTDGRRAMRLRWSQGLARRQAGCLQWQRPL